MTEACTCYVAGYGDAWATGEGLSEAEWVLVYLVSEPSVFGDFAGYRDEYYWCEWLEGLGIV